MRYNFMQQVNHNATGIHNSMQHPLCRMLLKNGKSKCCLFLRWWKLLISKSFCYVLGTNFFRSANFSSHRNLIKTIMKIKGFASIGDNTHHQLQWIIPETLYTIKIGARSELNTIAASRKGFFFMKEIFVLNKIPKASTLSYILIHIT